MNSEEKLTELLRTASGALGDEVHIDPRALIAQARRRRRRGRMVALCAAMAVAVAVVATIPRSLTRNDGVDVAVGGANSEPERAWTEPPEPGWTPAARPAALAPRRRDRYRHRQPGRRGGGLDAFLCEPGAAAS